MFHALLRHEYDISRQLENQLLEWSAGVKTYLVSTRMPGADRVIEKQDFIPDSADEPFTNWYFGTVRSKPAWQSEDNEEEYEEDE